MIEVAAQAAASQAATVVEALVMVAASQSATGVPEAAGSEGGREAAVVVASTEAVATAGRSRKSTFPGSCLGVLAEELLIGR